MADSAKKVLIFGKSGLLGGEFFGLLSGDEKFKVFGYDSAGCDIADFKQVQRVIRRVKPDIVVNCAAKVNIDRCEEDPLGSWMTNSIGPGNIARSLRISGRKVIFLHISTSDIFNGKTSGGYKENATPDPLNVYGWSKSAGERIIIQELKDINAVKYFIIRSGWLYGKSRKTFIESIVGSLVDKKSMTLVADQFSVPTWTRDLALQAISLIRVNNLKSGVYHLVNSYKSPVSKYDIGIFISDLLQLNPRVLKRGSQSKIFMTARPKYANLLNSKLPDLQDWKSALSEYLK